MRKLGVGIYIDDAAAIHISEAEMCEHLGVPYTAENAKVVEAAVATAAMREKWPSIKSFEVVEHDDGKPEVESEG